MQQNRETRHAVVVVLRRTACGPVIDVARINKKSRDDREQRHDRENHKHGAEASEITDAAGQRRGHDIAAMVESLVAPELVSKAALVHQPQRDGGDRRADRGAGDAGNNLCAGDDRKVRFYQDRQRRDRYGDCGSNNNHLFMTRTIDQRAGRRRHHHSGNAADGHDNADLCRRPLTCLQKHAEERTQSALHIGHEEIQRIERGERGVHDIHAAAWRPYAGEIREGR